MTQNTTTQVPSLDILQQFDGLLKNHSIVVTDRDILAKLFECIVDLCTQMPKTKLKAALKAATQQPKTKAKAIPKTKAIPKQPKQPNQSKAEPMVGPNDAADAPMITDLTEVPAVRGRGRPRKEMNEDNSNSTSSDSGEKKKTRTS